MMKCPNCGNDVYEGMNNCPNCGASLNSNGGTNVKPHISERNVVLAVIFEFLTCGIYGLYWFIVMTDESNSLVDENDKTASGGLALLYNLLSCGIYGIYWSYKMGKKMSEAGKKYNVSIGDNSVLYLILSILGFAWINWILIQCDLNKIVKA